MLFSHFRLKVVPHTVAINIPTCEMMRTPDTSNKYRQKNLKTINKVACQARDLIRQQSKDCARTDNSFPSIWTADAPPYQRCSMAGAVLIGCKKCSPKALAYLNTVQAEFNRLRNVDLNDRLEVLAERKMFADRIGANRPGVNQTIPEIFDHFQALGEGEKGDEGEEGEREDAF